MALASTSTTAPAAVLKTSFLDARRALANAATPKPAPRCALLAVAAAAAKKLWIPAFKSDAEFINPPWLDGSLPGDFGFDPLGLGKDPAFLKWYREAELIHGRWAMAAVLGIFMGQPRAE
ncbi:Chlorophyll a-b binding protein CP24 10B, chloroplastic [Zea mays]|uniref:Chlorophyll a-b binding protein, chloroplastic n=1 Tax=Zea mays TaxID=4577 RepID=A0A3L6DTP5_MAIZE|nr:Chlorophyll a-b binding protein CP24 10B, chloroplastic [Zea mays]